MLAELMEECCPHAYTCEKPDNLLIPVREGQQSLTWYMWYIKAQLSLQHELQSSLWPGSVRLLTFLSLLSICSSNMTIWLTSKFSISIIWIWNILMETHKTLRRTHFISNAKKVQIPYSQVLKHKQQQKLPNEKLQWYKISELNWINQSRCHPLK